MTEKVHLQNMQKLELKKRQNNVQLRTQRAKCAQISEKGTNALDLSVLGAWIRHKRPEI